MRRKEAIVENFTEGESFSFERHPFPVYERCGEKTRVQIFCRPHKLLFVNEEAAIAHLERPASHKIAVWCHVHNRMEG